MKVLEGPVAAWQTESSATAVTIGVLDGVHRGHRELLCHLDGGMVPTVLTFDPHPVEVLRPGTHPRLITTIDERVDLLEQADVEVVGVLDLDEIKDLEPDRFVREVLVDKLAVGRVVVGPDFRFGRDRSGDTGLLTDMGDSLGYETTIVDLVEDDRGVLSSSRIRELIEAGDVSGAANVLSTYFSVTSVVIGGDRRGRQLGFPTANLRPPERKVVPANGVYAALVEVHGVVHHAAVNVGVRPTFGEGERLIEAYIMDFDQDIYDEDLTVRFVDYLRPELEFSDVEALVAQMRRDVEQASELLVTSTPNVV